MPRSLSELLARIDARSVRERLLVAAVTLAILFLGVDLLLIEPATRALESERAALAQLEQERLALEPQLAQLEAALAVDPDAENRRLQQQLQAELQGVDAELEQRFGQLIGPEAMSRVLQDLLQKNARLTLLRIESEPATPVAGQGAEEAKAASGDARDAGGEAELETRVPLLYRHAVQIEFEGDYLSALAYLKAVEGLPWRFYWDRIEILTVKYPTATIRARLFTLSVHEGWIGV